MTLRNITFKNKSDIVVVMVMAKMMVIKRNIKAFFNDSCAPIENSVGYSVHGVTKENSLICFRLEFSKVIPFVKHKTPTSEDVKELYVRLFVVQPFIWCFCCTSVYDRSVLQKAGS